MTTRPRWVITRPPNPTARVRLICVPYAGGGPSAFRSWPAPLGPDIELCAVQLPGKEERFAEQPLTTMTDLLPPLLRELRPLMDRPYALFGHSMGGHIAVEIARALHEQHGPAPARLFLSGCAPAQNTRTPPRHLLTDPQLLDEIRRMNGAPAELLDNRDLMELMLPRIRADFTVVETFRHRPRPLPVPVTAFAGTQDPQAGENEVTAWRDTGLDLTDLHVLAGGHFFIHEHRDDVLRVIREQLLSPAAIPS
jgi:medium-chain acyl-[acyl-carrier-protein] hydrolase